ncbi:MAG TPA: threonine synthase [Clostridiales bacterium]|nr:threonine synthase [Clostridiales bacterium]
MYYNSTRDNSAKVTAAQAIVQGISKEGGLFVPETFPVLNNSDFERLKSLDYQGRAEYILKFFLTDFSDEEINKCVSGAYTGGKFDGDNPAPLVKLDDNIYMLELWHGPTCAFKDLALQLLPYLMTTSAGKVLKDKEIVILVATSGDTGKAALEGFKDVEGTKIVVFYPEDGVSPMQKLQMNTQEGSNVLVCAIKGNFDDAQTGVKKIFTDSFINKKLEEQNIMLSSANSINWGRLVPQIIYYVSSYCDLLSSGADLKDGFNVVVPTGNFGNILAAFYAKKMGVPISRLICASNANNVLTDFINTGEYNRNREFYTTISPSMDILISSNLERLLYDLCGRDDGVIKELMQKLGTDGKYNVTPDVLDKIKALFYAGYCDDENTLKTIKMVFDKYRYLCDTHTAVAVKVYMDYVKETSDEKPTVIASTANPYKFSKSVISALKTANNDDEFNVIDELSSLTKTRVPASISGLKNKPVRFNNSCSKEDMANIVLNFLNVK